MRKRLKCSLFCFVLFSFFSLNAQNTVSFFSLVKEKTGKNSYEHERVVAFGLVNPQKKMLFYNPLHLALAGMMYFYQKQVSQQLSTSCMYNPSCSSYSKLLIKRFGIIKGIICSSDRLMRCNRMSGASANKNDIDKIDHKIHESVERYIIK